MKKRSPRHRTRIHKRRYKKRQASIGAPPGTLEAPADAQRSKVEVIHYSTSHYQEHVLDDAKHVERYLGKTGVTWINVTGLADVNLVQYLGKTFKIHPLSLEDVLHVEQRPKTETHQHYQFITMRMFDVRVGLTSEQLSLFIGQDFVLTFQERAGDCLEPVRHRLRSEGGKIRNRGADYLAYALVDAVVDHYFPILEQYGERLEELEYQVTTAPHETLVSDIHDARHELLQMRRTMWPVRDMLRQLYREEFPLIDAETRVYFRDCYDHSLQILDLVETYREIGASLLDVYLSASSHQMNEVMKVLTLIATIFIPLTFIAGVYGMNFNTEVSPWNMPELGWAYGYPAALGLMAVSALALYLFFRRRGWVSKGALRAGRKRSHNPPVERR